MLERLGMTLSKKTNGYEVTVPSHRFDIQQEVDLVEEIVRLYGYDRIPGEPMLAKVQPGKVHPLEVLNARLTQFLVNRGYHETISYSFVDPDLQSALYPERKGLDLLNPISPELSQMRTGMWPGLLASMLYNIHRQQPSLKLFESGVTFERLSTGKVEERPCFAGLVTGTHGALNWLDRARAFDFFDIKGDLQALFAELHLKQIQWQAAEHACLHPGKSACLIINNETLGWVGALHPCIAEKLDLTDEVILFELELNGLLNADTPHYQKISKFPMIRRDLALLADEHVSADAIENVVRGAMTMPWLKSFAVFDVYQGEPVPKGKKSLAIALTLQDEQRTLQDNEINSQIDAILKKLNNELMVTLRE